MLRLAAAALAGLVLVMTLLAGAAAGVVSTLTGGLGRGAGTGAGSAPSQTAMADIPADHLLLYQAAAATCPGLDWAVLAAIGSIESDHGRSQLPGVHSGHNEKGAQGEMQFLPTTWATVTTRHPPPPGGASPPSPYNPHDAIYTAAAYLCDSGARNNHDLHAALFTYNRSEEYVTDVLARAARYRAGSTDPEPGEPSPAALTVVAFAFSELGQPYQWGGDGPAEGGFDCSGLTHAAYAAAGITIPRTADAQYRAGPLLPAGQPLLPGDLVFYGTPNHIHHVGVYIGQGRMVHAPDVGQTIRIAEYRWAGDDFVAAGRPV
jgi:cell wall-associated NlpC family hydrolase